MMSDDQVTDRRTTSTPVAVAGAVSHGADSLGYAGADSLGSGVSGDGLRDLDRDPVSRDGQRGHARVLRARLGRRGPSARGDRGSAAAASVGLVTALGAVVAVVVLEVVQRYAFGVDPGPSLDSIVILLGADR